MLNNDVSMLSDDLIVNLGLTRALSVSILDLFENLLDKHGIYIPDDDRNGKMAKRACMARHTVTWKIVSLRYLPHTLLI